MKKFVEIELEIVRLSVEDVCTASNLGWPNDGETTEDFTKDGWFNK